MNSLLAETKIVLAKAEEGVEGTNEENTGYGRCETDWYERKREDRGTQQMDFKSAVSSAPPIIVSRGHTTYHC